MTVTRPNIEQIMSIGTELGMTLTYAEAEEYLGLMAGNLAAYDVVDAEPDFTPPVTYPRTTGFTPAPADNPFGAWARKVTVEGAAEGKLKGKTVALKDNVALAGVPMTNGASTLEGFIPVADATIVTRMLDAGATIEGKAVSEYFCLSGGAIHPSREWCITRVVPDIPLAVHPRGRQPLSVVDWSIWQSVAIRADPSVCLLRSAGSRA